MTEFRKAGPADVPELSRLARSAYAVYQPRMRRPPAPVTADYAAAVRAGQVWVAEEGGRLAGLVVLADASGALLLENIAVHPDAQGRGLGAGLLALAEREAARRGMAEIRLYTNEAMTANLAYYPRHGYTETHRAQEDGFRRVFFAKQLGGQAGTFGP